MYIEGAPPCPREHAMKVAVSKRRALVQVVAIRVVARVARRVWVARSTTPVANLRPLD